MCAYFSQFSSISSAVRCAHFKFQKCVDSLGISIDPKNLTKINSSLLFFEGQENITSRRVICDNFQIPLAFDQSTYDIWIYPKFFCLGCFCFCSGFFFLFLFGF